MHREKGKTMKFLLALFGILALTVLTTLAAGQDVPKGVNYKKAPEPVNSAAKTALETALVADAMPSEFLGEVFVCGPMLWKGIRPSADKVLRDAKPVVGFIQVPEPIQTEAKSILKPDERQSFWRVLFVKYPALKTAKVRKAHAAEISYYWATIPFDIEEPFFVIETSSERFVAHLRTKDGKTTLFWIDLVGDLRTLKP